MTAQYFDDLEARDPDARALAIAERLPAVVANAKKAPGWAKQLEGIEPASITSLGALAKLPLLRKADLVALQKAAPPFGGFNTLAAGQAKRILMSPGPIFEFESMEADAYGAGRAVYAAGIRAGDIAINCFSYHLTPGAYILESGLETVGCAVIPGGVGNTEQQVEAIVHARPQAYTGTPDFLKVLLDHAAKNGKDVTSIERGLVSGAALPPSLRSELSSRGVDVLQCYAIAEIGVIAYESNAREGLIVNEHLVVEIVKPGTGDPVAEGEVGEVVVTSFNAAYPMIRLATGDLSAVLAGASPCGRTNMRIKGWMGRADQTTKVKGMFVHPGQVADVARRHPQFGRVRLVVTRANELDQMTLHAECASPSPALSDDAAASLQTVTKMRGEIKLVAPGSLPNDGKLISDERPV